MIKTLQILSILAVAGLINFVNAQTPNWVWAKSAGSTSLDQGRCVATDANGNVFATGYYYGPSITFGTITLNNLGSGDVFLVKYDASGNVLWANSAGGNGYELGNGIATDANGDVFITGTFNSDTMSFDSAVLTNANNNTGVYEDIFVAKYDSNGNFLWARSAGGTNSNDVSNSVATDLSGNVFITGYFHSPTINFGGTILTNSTPPYEDIFLVKYDSNGNVIWAKSAGSINTSSPSDRGQSVATDANGNVVITGFFEGAAINLGSTIITNTNTDFGDIFIVKYDASGNVVWARSAGSISNDLGTCVATDGSGNVFISGYFNGFSINFGTTTLTNANQTFIFTREVFIVKYSAAGTVLWAKGASGINDDYSTGIVCDVVGNVYLTGAFGSPTITFGTTTLNNTGTFFLVKYDPNGNMNWVDSPAGASSAGTLGLTADANGSVFITGGFGGASITLGNNTLTNVGSNDFFLAKMDTIVTTSIEEPVYNQTFVIAPNPFDSQTTISFNFEQKGRIIKIMDVMGREIRALMVNSKQLFLDRGELQSGIYYVLSFDDLKNVVSKKIVIE